ncbi:MAG: biosynthetic-type acetolactate synthase large subunit [Gemmatimonadetes bacterium]|nr:biosynthetic-type acetolactate synthase large subunit [Gemmatimonadota bacterium]
MFGHPGGAILPFYDALFRAGAPRHVLMRHEQAAAHAADGYARATGRTGVCVATSGPGATNLVTGLATALMDSVPLVAITGQVPTSVQGTDAFQETDVLGMTMPVTKHCIVLEHARDVHAAIRSAFRIARSGRPGPVVVDVPKDVQNALWDVNDAVPHVAEEAQRIHAPDERAIAGAIALIGGAERPLIMAGRGVILSGTAAELRVLAETADLPVVTTLLGLDAFPATHPQALGMPGMHGTVRACRAIQRADVILGLGLRFDDRVTGPPATFAPEAAIIHVDIDPTVFGRTVRPSIAIASDLRCALRVLAERIPAARRPAWWEEMRMFPREVEVPPWEASTGAPTSGRAVARTIAERVAADHAIITTDVGQHQMWLAQELRDAEPGTHLTSGGLGTMGYALPAAIGAAIGRPDRSVWALAGDGGFQMTLQELATIAQERLPIRIAVLNNGYLGMVRQWQELFYSRRYAATALSGPDLITLARAYGIPAIAVESHGLLAAAVDCAARAQGPVLLDLRVDPEENVYPMVPPGAALHQVVAAPLATVAS